MRFHDPTDTNMVELPNTLKIGIKFSIISRELVIFTGRSYVNVVNESININIIYVFVHLLTQWTKMVYMHGNLQESFPIIFRSL